METLTAGTMAGAGSFRCEECGHVVKLAEQDTLGACPDCGGKAYARATLFGGQRFGRETEPPPMSPEQRGAWLGQVKRGLTGPGQYLAYEDGDQLVTVSLENEWTRVAGTRMNGYSGDGGPAIIAQLDRPQGLAVDTRGAVPPGM